jgi:hypothetical protein
MSNFKEFTKSKSTTSLSSSNTNTMNKDILKSLEISDSINNKVLCIIYDLETESLPSIITNSSFSNPKYMIYRKNITHSNLVHPISNFPTTMVSSDKDFVGQLEKNTNLSSNWPTSIAAKEACLKDNNCTAYTEGITSYTFYKSPLSFGTTLARDATNYIKRNNCYAMKIFAYLNITKDDNYTIEIDTPNFTNCKTKLFLNGFNILDGTLSPEIVKTNIYLKTGVYFIYIEHISRSNPDTNLNINMYPTTSTITTTKIDTYLHPTLNYTLLTNITSSRDKSIVEYCKDQTNLLTAGNVCESSLKSNSLLNDQVQQVCFQRGTGQKNLLTGNDGKFNSNCKDLVVNTNNIYNKTISDNAKQKYNEWANRIVKDNTINDNKDRLEEYLNILNPNETIFGLDNNIRTYCEINSKDSYNIPTNDTLCTNIYNRTYTGNNKIYQRTSLANIKTNYCTSKDTNGNLRYENDTNCKNDYTTLLKNTINSRCLQNNKYKEDDQWCNKLIDNNITSNEEPYKTLITARNNLIEMQIASTTANQTKPLLNTNTYNYVIGKYNESVSKKLPEELLNQKLYDYCETKEANYPIIDNSQCKGIYNKFNNEQGIKDSQKRMQESLCKLPTNITTSNPNDGKTNAYLCKDTIFNTNENLAKFAETVATHCAANINSPECTNYYKDIEDKILQQYIPPNPILTQTVSKFSNKNKDSPLHEYQNIVLESYENGTVPTNSTDSTEETECTESIDLIPVVESNLIILSEDNNDILYYILVFVFILLMVTLIYSYSYKKKKSNNKNVIPEAIPIELK